MGSLDLPDEPDRAERAGDAGAGRSRKRETPDPDERGRAYEAARAHVSAETSEEAPAGRRPEERRVTADRSADPPGSYRGDGGAYLNPERHAQAAEAVGRVREAEPAISADVQAVEQENRYGGWLEGFGNRLKGEDRLKEKIAEGLATASPDATPDQVLRLIPDAIRYTFCFEQKTYAKGYNDIKEQLENRGYEMYYSKNWWTNPEYKGINTRWVTLGGQPFEVQFHTQESFHAKHHVTHGAYERIRDPTTSRTELRELHEFQREVSSWIQLPDDSADIPDFKKEGF